MQSILNKALEELKAHFSNSPHHTHIFMESENYQSLYDIACKSLETMFSTPENKSRLAVYINSNGEAKAVQSIVNQGRVLILQGLLAISKAPLEALAEETEKLGLY